MKNKLEILARLLKEDKITVDEFIILSARDIEYIYRDKSALSNPLPPYVNDWMKEERGNIIC